MGRPGDSVDKPENVIAVLPLHRGSTLASASLWLLPAVGLGGVAVAVFSQLHFIPSGTSNRLVDYSLAVLMIPIVLGAAAFAIRAAGLACMAAWPGSVGVFAGPDELTIKMGPFGTKRYDVARLDVRYPYELPADDGEEQFEALLPHERQVAELIPRITHPDARELIDRTIRRMAGVSEDNIVRILRPAIYFYRAVREVDKGARVDAEESGAGRSGTDGA